jgi:hypothetical protein
MNIELTKPEAAAYHAAIIHLLTDVPATIPALNELIEKLDAVVKSKPVAESTAQNLSLCNLPPYPLEGGGEAGGVKRN